MHARAVCRHVRSCSTLPESSIKRIGALNVEDRDEIKAMLRINQAAERSFLLLKEGQTMLSHGEETDQLNRVREMDNIVSDARVRPSILSPVWGAVAYSVGFASACLGPQVAKSVLSATEQALRTQYNDQVRALHERGLTEEVELKELLKSNRDAREEEEENLAEENSSKESCPPASLVSKVDQTINATVLAASKTAIYLSNRL